MEVANAKRAVPEPVQRRLLPGRISIARGSEHLCRTQIVSFDAATVDTAASGRIGEAALCYVENIGILPGVIVAVTQVGFRLELNLTDERRTRVAARLTWHVDAMGEPVERRVAERVVPNRREVVVVMPDGPVFIGTIEDLSRTGAKISLSAPGALAFGSVVIVGKRYATVSRIEDAAIAVCFRLPFTDETFNADVIL